MNFYTAHELRNTPKAIWDNLNAGSEVIITNNGKPKAIMIDIEDGRFEETLRAVRQAKALLAFSSMRQTAADQGYMTDAEIEAEIAAARQED